MLGASLPGIQHKQKPSRQACAKRDLGRGDGVSLASLVQLVWRCTHGRGGRIICGLLAPGNRVDRRVASSAALMEGPS
jgi:hypothetical protein